MTIQHKSFNEKELVSKYEDGLNKRPKDDYKRKPKNSKQLHSWLYEDEDDEIDNHYIKTSNKD